MNGDAMIIRSMAPSLQSTELNYELSSMGTPSKEAPSVPECGHPWPRNEPVKEHPESNHSKWVGSKLAEGQ